MNQPVPPTPAQPQLRVPTLAWCLSGLGVVLAWLLDITGHGVPLAVNRLLVLACVVLGCAWAGERVVAALRQPDAERRRAAAILLGLLAVAAVTHFTGISHEAEGRYSGDERTYYGHALQINDGEVFRDSFIYPHLPYYACALVLWLANLFWAPVAMVVAAATGYTSPEAIQWTLLHGLMAAFGALTVWPVFRIGQRLGGNLAGALGGALIVASPVYNEICHLLLCDVPAAFFVALTLSWVAALGEQESLRAYLAAGMASGLAAASKYPGGMVVVTIVAVYGLWRLRTRRFSASLLWAGLASLGSFLLFMPSLFVHWQAATSGPKSLFFGPRLYARGGWIGIVKPSNAHYYLDLIVQSFGWVALGLGLLGLGLAHRQLRRLPVLAIYPLVALTVMVSVNVAVKRSILPVLPMLAALLGCGLAAGMTRLASWRRSASPALLTALAVLCLAQPAVATTQQAISFARPSTRDLAVAWIREHLPPGSMFLREHYTPRPPRGEYRARMSRFAARLSPAQLRDPQLDYLLLSSNAYGRFLDPRRHTKPHHKVYEERYQRIFSEDELLLELVPSATRRGPGLRIYKLPEPAPPYPPRYDFNLRRDAFLPQAGMLSKGVVTTSQASPWLAFKVPLAAGRYRLQLDGELAAESWVEALDLGNHALAREPIAGDNAAELELGQDGKVVLYLHLAPGSRLTGAILERLEP